MTSNQLRGCAYGYRVDVNNREYLNVLASSLPCLDVEFEPWSPQPPGDGWRETVLGPSWALWMAPDALRVICRSDPPYDDDRVIHPGLAAASVVASLYGGGEALHAGAVCADDGAIALLAERGGGKTTTLGYLASRLGLGVLTDDQLVLRDHLLQAGPRCLDLRPEAADALDLRGSARQVRDAQRWRLRLDDVPLTAPLADLVLLEWGDDVRVERVPPGERLAFLGRHRTLPGSAGGRLMPLWLASLPMRRLTRPRGAEHLPAVARALLGG